MAVTGRKLRLQIFLSCSAIASALAGSPAWAQEPVPPTLQPAVQPPPQAVAGTAAQTQPATGADGDIVVTARQRSETLISVPVSVSVLNSQQVDRYKADDLSKIGELVPSVIVGVSKANGGASIAIRGISTPANTSGFEQAVSVAIDGVQTSNGRIAQLGFFDIGQVEVLEGPQALFFGKNSPAGVISIKTAMPTSELSARIRETYEFVGDETTTDAILSGPLTGTLGARLALRYRHLAGWLYNDSRAILNPFYVAGAPAGAATLPGAAHRRIGDEDYQGRLTLEFRPASNLTAVFKLFGYHSNDDGSGVASQAIGCLGPQVVTAGVLDPNSECRADNHTSNTDLPAAVSQTLPRGSQSGVAYGRLDGWIGSFALDAKLGKVGLSALTGYNSIQSQAQFGHDQSTFSQLEVIERPVIREFSQQLRATTDLDGAVNFMAGAYYQRIFNSQYNNLIFNQRSYVPAVNRFDSVETFGVQRGRTVSLFGQAIVNLTQRLELAGGVRWTNEHKDAQVRNTYGIGPFNTLAITYPGSSTPGVLVGRYRDSNFSPEATLTFRPDHDHTFYVAYKTAFKSGGFTLAPIQTTTTIADQDFGPERAKGFEAGAKAAFAGGRGRATLTAFRYNFNGQQVSIYDAINGRFIISNAGSVRQRGVSGTLSLQATEALNVHGALTYAHNRFQDFIGQCYGYTFPTGTVRATAVAPPNCTFAAPTGLTLEQNYDGRAPARSPELTANAGGVYRFHLGGLATDLTGDAFYSDAYYAADNLNPGSRQNSFWRFNASVSLHGPNDRWELAFIGRNLSNRYYLQFASDRTGGASIASTPSDLRAAVARGRELALQATVSF